jgi:hypothetical protein
MFTKGPGDDTDSFGPNTFLRSTKGLKQRSVTLAHKSIPEETINGYPGRRVLQRGEMLCKITSGEFAGSVGPHQEGATDGRGTLDNFVGFSDTYVPWRANVRDVNIAAVYEASVVKAWTFKRAADGKRVPIEDEDATAVFKTERTAYTFH